MSILTGLATQAFFNEASPSVGIFRTEPKALMKKRIVRGNIMSNLRALVSVALIAVIGSVSTVAVAGGEQKGTASHSTAEHGAERVFSEGDAGHVRQVLAHRLVTIRLPSNPSTGYQWEVLRARNVKVQQPIDTVPDPKTPAGVVGAPEVTVIHVMPGQSGPASLELGYVGPGGKRPDRVLHYRFTVK
ncbi:protease inhibitor I42 family protein [Pseudomonas oryzihabitans]|uniref:protease inhibitor I42 family protein n=1 Tax=Pseudomonas oryzihabitans TaxID=47885 RepID=UPI002861C707|nr:protease inhibitor I42 family protein [Pseudomonas psychrotolerans]MDR6675835.1 putative secreted protein [Pseudomonas psychrotolerans]